MAEDEGKTTDVAEQPAAKPVEAEVKDEIKDEAETEAWGLDEPSDVFPDLNEPDPMAEPEASADDSDSGKDGKVDEPSHVAAPDPEIVAKAKEAGLDDEDVAFLGSDRLAKAVDRLTAIRPPAVEPKTDEEKAAEEKAIKEAEADLEIDLKDDEIDADPAVLALLRRQSAELNKLRAAERERHKTAAAEAEGVRKQAETEFVQFFDGAVKGLGEAYEPVLGKGNHREIVKNEPMLAARRKVIKRMHLIALGHEAEGEAVPSHDDLFKEAVAGLFPDHTNKLARTTIRKALKDREATIGEQPTHRTSDLPLGRQRAVNAVRELLGKFREEDEDFEMPVG